MLKVYVAAPWACRPEAEFVAEELERNDCVITRKWWRAEDTKDEQKLIDQSQEDLAGVDACDVLVYLGLQKSEGKATELGYAMGKGKHCIALVPKTSMNIFTNHPKVRAVRSLDDIIYQLIEIEADRATT